MRLLEIRKPLMTGSDVKHLQRLLRAAGMKPGPLDGEFGPRTAAACNHYKWRIGYSRRQLPPRGRRPAHRVPHGQAPADRGDATPRRRPPPQGAAGARGAGQAASDAPARARHHQGRDRHDGAGRERHQVHALVGLGRRRLLRHRHRVGVDAGRQQGVQAGRRAGRTPTRCWPTPRPAGTDCTCSTSRCPAAPGVIDFDGHSDPDHGITCIRVEGDEVVTGEFNTTKDGTSLEGVWEKRRPLRNTWWFAVEC